MMGAIACVVCATNPKIGRVIAAEFLAYLAIDCLRVQAQQRVIEISDEAKAFHGVKLAASTQGTGIREFRGS
ncbi:MAG: hypothetical protein Q7S40_28395 [Opitutaceae bacterium]|nr:hypothetical protein [Opitutaceae bacterium]